jgi:heat shock protein HtpX
LISELLLGLLATMIVMAFSRYREFRADQGGARLAGSHNMIAALESLRRSYGEPLPAPQLAAFGINGAVGVGLKRLFMSHPPLDERINALREAAVDYRVRGGG